MSQHLKVLKDAGLVTDRAAALAGSTGSTRPASPRCATSSTRSGTARWPATGTSSNRRQHRRRSHDPDTTPRSSARQIVVDAPIERAFTVFTDRFGDFKPPEHNLLGAPIAETVFEPHVGGHIYDRGERRQRCRWARVLAYEPPDRVVFSWDISPPWQLETEPENTSEVEVRFVAETPQRTRVELEHRNIDRHGPGWEAVSDGVDGDEGWPLYLTRYAASADRGRLTSDGRHSVCWSSRGSRSFGRIGTLPF